MSNDKLESLKVYAERLNRRLSGNIPERHKHRPDVFKAMIELDLKKTLKQIERLTK